MHRVHISLIEEKNMIKYKSIKIFFLSEVAWHTNESSRNLQFMWLRLPLFLLVWAVPNFPVSVSLSVEWGWYPSIVL